MKLGRWERVYYGWLGLCVMVLSGAAAVFVVHEVWKAVTG